MPVELVGDQFRDTDGPGLSVEFFEHPKKVGVGQYIPVDYIKIRVNGQRDFSSRRATEEDKTSYPKEWEAYQAGLVSEDADTTPLTMLPGFRTAFSLELADRGIHTAEELALLDEVPDYLSTMHRNARLLVKLKSEGEDEGQPGSTQREIA